MCIVGVARELAAHFGLPLTVPEPSLAGDASIGRDVAVAVEAPDRCPWFTAWALTVTMGSAPDWMQRRLVKAGMRPINNVVDVTNYVMLERNQPLHAFDLARLGGRGIVVRLAANEETMTTLDGIERTFTDEDLLVCDAESVPQGIAGIMGGATSEVSETTTELLLEAAYFERMGIARSSKRLKLRSEASARFERGIDPDAVARHTARGIELLVEIAGARPANAPVSVRAHEHERPRITLRTSKVNRVLGTSLTDAQVCDALVPLGVDVKGKGKGKADKITAVPPSFRPDLEREIDLVEEVGRRVGFAAIGRTVPKPHEQIGGLSRAQRDRRTAADALVGAGLFEAITVPLVPAAAEEGRMVLVANPLRAEDSALRTGLLPGLLRVTASNHARGNTDVGLFEIGRVFFTPADGPLPDEPVHVAALLAGTVCRAPVEPDRPVDVYDAIDALGALLDALEIAKHQLVAATVPGMHATRAASVEVDGDTVGSVGEIAGSVCAAVGMSGPVVGFEVDLDAIIGSTRRDRAFVTPSPYPVAAIDLAFVINDDVPAASIAATIHASAEGLAEEVLAFDEFRDDSFGAGRRSLAFRVRYRAPDRTLTDAEVVTLRQHAIDAVAKRHGASLRG
jgi:phenylalanyl-tRNA synthetase beta chain